MNTKKILFQGDSITDGNRNKDESQRWDGNHQIGHSYAFSVCGMLAVANPAIRYKFENRGISGNKVSDIFDRAENDIINIAPDIMTLLCGINDGPVWEREFTPINEFENTYSELLNICRSHLPHMKIVLLEPFYLPVGPHNQHESIWNDILPQYQRAVRKLSEKFDTDFLPLQCEFDKMTAFQPKEYWLWDGIHPSESGHGIIAEKLFNILQNL